MTQSAFVRCRLDVGLALATYRYAAEHGITVSDTIRYALMLWTSRSGYLEAAQIASRRDINAAQNELRTHYRRKIPT